MDDVKPMARGEGSGLTGQFRGKSGPTTSPAQQPAQTLPDDGELARRVAKGDREAAAMLITRHHASVRAFLRRLTGRDDLADDLAQETFLRALENAHRFDPTYAMRTWLFTIARRLTINVARRSDSKVMSTEFEGMRNAGPQPEDAVDAEDHNDHLRRKLDKALAQLSEPQRVALVLVHQQGLSVEQAAEAMKMPPGTVKSHLHRGRAVMRTMLMNDQEMTST